MKIYDVVLEKRIQDNEKTILNSFNDLDEAKSFLCDEAHKTLDTIGKSLLDNFLMGNCKCPEPYISVYCSNGDENGPFDQYDYSIEERDIDEKYLISMPVYIVTEEEKYSDKDYFFHVLKVFNEKYKAIEYMDKIIQKTLDHYYGSKIDPKDKNTVIYKENNSHVGMDCYIKFKIEEYKIQ